MPKKDSSMIKKESFSLEKTLGLPLGSGIFVYHRKPFWFNTLISKFSSPLKSFEGHLLSTSNFDETLFVFSYLF